MTEKMPLSPYDFFDACFTKAKSLRLPQHDAMVLITSTPEAKPAGRMVLLKEVVRDQGFRFFTNYLSRKSSELFSNPQAQLLFYWPAFGRQIRVEGNVAQVSAEVSDAYWLSRSRGSRIGAIASQQSRPLDSMEELQERVAFLEKKFEGKEVPRPDHWGGFELVPNYFEFWDDRTDRLHERVTYTKIDSTWIIGRLNP